MAKVEALSRKIDHLTMSRQQMAAVEPVFGEEQCMEQVDYLGNPSRP